MGTSLSRLRHCTARSGGEEPLAAGDALSGTGFGTVPEEVER
jgi:hypothetical protein